MLVVVASDWDEGARTLVQRWEPHGAALLSVRDLSTRGWRHYLGGSDHSQCVIGGEVVANRDVSGVLIRLPAVTEQELPQIVPEDRAYAGAEMTAFLLSWLSTLQCPILNGPFPPCLGGPNYRREQWALRASQLHLPVAPQHRHIPPFAQSKAASADENTRPPTEAHPNAVQMTVIGERCVGAGHENLSRQARLLAASVGVDLLAVVFSGPEDGSQFIEAHPWANVWDDAVVEALFDYFDSRARLSPQRGGTA